MTTPILKEDRFNQILEEWKNTNTLDNNQELIESIEAIFRDCYQQGDPEMGFYYYVNCRDFSISVQTLPKELFCYPPFNKYRELDLSSFRFHKIPETIFLNTELEELDLSHNPITTISENIGKLKNLTKLTISDTPLSTLPKEIGELESLEYLQLSGNSLKEVPDSFGNLVKLTTLFISRNSGDISQENDLPEGLIKHLPRFKNLQNLLLCKNRIEELSPQLIEALEGLVKLRRLDLSQNGLQTLPANLEFFRKYKNLEYLHFSYNSLSAISSDFFTVLNQAENLKVIHLEKNRLTFLPDTFKILPRQVRLLLYGNRFSSEEVERILNITRERDYDGPNIELSIDDGMERIEKNVVQIIIDLYITAKLPIKDLYLPHTLELKSWLNRIGEIPEFKSERNRQILAKKIVAILEEASVNPEFKEIFYEIIADASETCGDRVGLSILYLDIQQSLEKLDCSDMTQLATFLSKGPWTLSLLEQCARKKVTTLMGIEEIETYLAYPIYLKEELDIPILQEDMLYFRCSGVTEEDLQEAKNFVLEHRNNEEKQLEFLLSQKKWIEALRINYPEIMKQIETEREEFANQENLDAEGYAKIQEKYNTKLLDLSREILFHSEAV